MMMMMIIIIIIMMRQMILGLTPDPFSSNLESDRHPQFQSMPMFLPVLLHMRGKELIALGHSQEDPPCLAEEPLGWVLEHDRRCSRCSPS